MTKINEIVILTSDPMKIVRVRGRLRKDLLGCRHRWQFERITFCVHVLVFMISLSLPIAWGLARSATSANGMNNRSRLENFFLRSRPERIKTSIQKEYSSQVASVMAESDAETTNAGTPTFIFPGAGGVDELVLELQSCTPNSRIIDWKDQRGSVLTAGFDSEAVGEAVAELVLDNIDSRSKDADDSKNGSQQTSALSGIRFIGISVGAFAANAAATVVHQQLTGKSSDDRNRCDPREVHLVLLDPFCGRGILGPNYGRKNFGKHATTALQIMNTDDPVPTTNDPLPLCYCIDVTDAPERKDFVPLPGDSMHSWPLAYFARHYGNNHDTTVLPRGKVEKVS